ncbi:tetratricopeptide repeat protein [Nostoc sp.]
MFNLLQPIVEFYTNNKDFINNLLSGAFPAIVGFFWWLKWRHRQRRIPEKSYQALKIKPDDYEAWYNGGNALVNLGKLEEAIASYDQALKIKPDDHQAWYNRGIALRNLERLEEAIASYDQAVSIKPDYHEPWYNRGIALGNLGRLEKAIASYEQAIKIKPDKDNAWYNKACCYTLLGNVDLAIENLQQAINLNPECREIAKTNTDFDNIREDRQFQDLINH